MKEVNVIKISMNIPDSQTGSSAFLDAVPFGCTAGFGAMLYPVLLKVGSE